MLESWSDVVSVGYIGEAFSPEHVPIAPKQMLENEALRQQAVEICRDDAISSQ